jgi:hypothetical protein
VSGLKNNDRADLLENLIVPISNELIRANPAEARDREFISALHAARSDLQGIAERLRADVVHTGRTQ